MNIHGQIQGELKDITQDALCELRNAVFGIGTYMTNPVHEHYHNTLNNSDFLNSIYEIKRKLESEFFSRDTEVIIQLMKWRDARLHTPKVSRRNRGL